MTDSFINTKNKHRVNAAAKMMQYPHKYFANPKNINRLKGIFEYSTVMVNFLEWFHQFQSELVVHLCFDDKLKQGYERIQSVLHNKTHKSGAISSSFNKENIPFEATTKLIRDLDFNVAENVNSLQIKKTSMCQNLIAMLIQSSWLTEHFALLTLGALKLEINDDNQYEFRPNKPEVMEYIWFGKALENASVESDNQAVKSFAEHLMNGNPNDRETYDALLSNVYSIVSKHWRIGNEKPIQDLFNKLADVIVLLISTCQRALSDDVPKPLSKGEIRNMMKQSSSLYGLMTTYEEVKKFQNEKLVEDRLFDIEKGGLVQGPLEVTRGLIAQMENFAFRRYGSNWQNQMEKYQKAHIFEYLKGYKHLDILDFELKSDHIEMHKRGEIKLDVDYFIRDRNANLIYAVQMKHLQQITESGIASWLKMIGEFDSRLNTAILQLQNLKSILDNDISARDYLIENGISEREFNSIIPVVVHNVGYIDIMPVQNNIWLYDQITFRKVLTGQSGVQHIYKNGQYQYNDFCLNQNEPLRLDNPSNIINSYLSAKEFHGFRLFNIAKHCTREFERNEVSVKAVGVGL